MATRTIPDPRDRLATILIAPLMTCSARLPVYALLIAAFIPQRTLAAFSTCRAWCCSRCTSPASSARWRSPGSIKRYACAPRATHALLLELPAYRWPNLRNLALGLWERAKIFLKRVGTIILALTVLLWFLSSFPAPPAGATGPADPVQLRRHARPRAAVVFAPIGFNWQICIALVPGLAAREVAVGALGTVYALSASAATAAGS